MYDVEDLLYRRLFSFIVGRIDNKSMRAHYSSITCDIARRDEYEECCN